MSNNRFRDGHKRRDRRKYEPPGKSFSQAPIILDRAERLEKPNQPNPIIYQEVDETPKIINTNEPNYIERDPSFSSIPFLRGKRFNADTILKNLSDHPGHFVIGTIGKQGVGKSTVLSHFSQDPEHIFPVQDKDKFLYNGHKTDGIDMYITPERAILLDTEPVLSWTVLDKTIQSGSLGGLQPDLLLEMKSLYNIIYMLSVCNVVIFVTEGPEIDMDLLRLIQRAEMLKFCIPDFPLLAGQQDMDYYSDIVFVCNKCKSDEFTWKHFVDLQSIMNSFFKESHLKHQGLVSLGTTLPLFEYTQDKESNLFLLPHQAENSVESFDVLISALKDQVVACPRRPGKKGQVSEKDWFRNAIKIFELMHKSDYISEYLQIARKLIDS